MRVEHTQLTELQIARHIFYSFRDTNWDWNNLTPHEKKIYPDQAAVYAARDWADDQEAKNYKRKGE